MASGDLDETVPGLENARREGTSKDLASQRRQPTKNGFAVTNEFAQKWRRTDAV